MDSLSNSSHGGKDMMASKILGYAVVMGSGLFKVPQIVRIIRFQSVEGLSPFTYMLELVAQGTNIIYYTKKKFPVSTWGEFLLIGIQNVIILVFVQYVQKEGERKFIPTKRR